MPKFYVAAVVLVIIASFAIGESSVLNASVTLTDKGKATLELIGEMNKLTLTLNSALFAGAGLLAIKGREWSPQWNRLDGYSTVAALICGSVAYYAVYVVYVELLGMVYAGVIDPFALRLRLAFKIQYFSVLIGVFLIGLIFARLLEARKASE
jgi:hypothetical protein